MKKFYSSIETWECECDDFYTHPMSDTMCQRCKAHRDEDSKGAVHETRKARSKDTGRIVQRD